MYVASQTTNTIKVQFLGLWCDAEYIGHDAEAPDPHTGYPGCNHWIEVTRLSHKDEDFDLSDINPETIADLVEKALDGASPAWPKGWRKTT